MSQSMSLVTYLANVTLVPLVQKRLMGKPYVTTSRLLFAKQLLFEFSMLLGYRYHSRLNAFAKLISQPGKESNAVAFLQTTIRDWVDKFKKEPTDFMEVYFLPELDRLGLDFTQLLDIGNKKLDAEQLLETLEMASVYGIAFGSVLPELTEQIWQKVYGSPADTKTWNEAFKAGVNIPEKPSKPISIEEGQDSVIPVLQSYLEAYRPELMNEFV